MAPKRRKNHANQQDADEADTSTATTSSNDAVEHRKSEGAPKMQRSGSFIDNVKLPTPSRPAKKTYLYILLGGFIGLILALFLLHSQDVVDIEALTEAGLGTLTDMLPPSVVKEIKSFSQPQKDQSYDAFQVGLHLRRAGIKAHFPVVMIPGVISTGLESWGTSNISRPYFRKRMWGSSTMLRCLVLDKALWKRHIMLNHSTGLDPDGIKLRAAQGFDATDFFITGYWIWNKIVENLATIGYDPTSSYTAAYDWRLSYINLEKRDQYFTRLKQHIEVANSISGKKTILVAHSMGSQVVFFFLKWVEAVGHGNGGSDWVEKHIDSFINISGSMLGAVKGLPAVLSGEMKDTAQLNQMAVYGLERFFGREERAEIMRSMPGISSMLPKGGDAIWGNLTWAPDDAGQDPSFGNFLKFRVDNSTHGLVNLTVAGAIDYLLDSTEPWFRDQVLGSYSHGLAKTFREIEANEMDPTKWINPLEVRLPYAPNMKIYCFYGVGKPTERSYFYQRQNQNNSILHATIDTTVNGNATDHGIVVGEGDGTVSLLSQGFMCARGWKEHRYNPAGIPIKIVEMHHDPMSYDMRGGPNTADHVDILGRPQLNELILRVAAGHGDSIKEKIITKIREYSAKVDLD